MRAKELNSRDSNNLVIDINSLSTGWHLLGTDKTLYNLKDNFNDITILWTYKDGNWNKNPSTIQAGTGFWILK
jgi:hypothetical protein